MANDYTDLFSLLTTIGMVVIETLKKKSYRKKSWNSDQELIRQFRQLPSSILEESGGARSTKSMDSLVSDALKALKIEDKPKLFALLNADFSVDFRRI